MNEFVLSCLVSAALWSVGDVLAQLIESSKFTSALRTVRIAVFGGLIFAPLTGRWFTFLNETFPDLPASVDRHDSDQLTALMSVLISAWPVAARVVVDQVIYSPFILTVLFLSVGLMECNGWSAAVNKWRAAIVPSLIRNWQVWPVVQTVNQSLIPPSYRLLVTNVVAVPWTAYLAYQAANANAHANANANAHTTTKPPPSLPQRQRKSDVDADEERDELIA